MAFKNIKDMLAAGTKDRSKPKDKPPLTANGAVVPEYDAGDSRDFLAKPIATQIPEPQANPYHGLQCAIKGCKQPVQYKTGGVDHVDLDTVFHQPNLSNLPLAAQIEMTVQHMHAAQQVHQTETIALCLEHYGELLRTAEATATARLAAEQDQHRLDYATAKIEDVGSTSFVISDGHGRRLVCPIGELDQEKSRIAGKTWLAKPLTPAEVAKVRYRVSAEGQYGAGATAYLNHLDLKYAK
ncbi:MAG TPA: hypothetical protein VGG75_06270 [Trebonia sp.]|jgi:hypothetical protein